MSSFSTAPSNSSSGIFGSRPVFGLANQTRDQLAPTSVFCFRNSTSGGTNATRSAFNIEQSHCGAQERGSRVTDYKRTPATPASAEKVVSISAMPAYENKSHEELRWEDYKSIGKGGVGLSSSAAPSTSSNLSAFTLSPVTNFSTTSWKAASMSTTPVKTDLFGSKFPSVTTEIPIWKFPGPTQTATWKNTGPTSTSFTSQPLNFSFSAHTSLTNVTAAPSKSFNPFAPITTTSSVSFAPLNNNSFTNPFTSQATQTCSFSFSSPTFAASTSCQATTPPSLNAFWSTPTDEPSSSMATAAVNSASVSPAPLYNIPFINPSVSPAHQLTTTTFPIPTSAALIAGQPSTSSSYNAFWSTPIYQPSISVSTQQPANAVWVAPTSSGLNSAFNQPTTSFKPCVPSTLNFNGEVTGVIGKNQMSSSQITSMEQPSSAASPFGTLPPKPQMLFKGSQSTQLTQYGISSLPVKYKPAPVSYPMLSARHLSRRTKPPIRKYDPKLNDQKIPFFSDTMEIPVDVFVPRENPRELVVFREMWSSKTITKNIHQENFSGSINENERDDPTKDQEMFSTVPDIPSKLQQLDYFTQPGISELKAKERAEPGYCSHVKDFVVGRHGYGSIKFLGETDVRKLDLETQIQFNYREVIVYTDESMKPPVGEGLNKPAEITLLNIKCVDKRTGMRYMDGLKVDKYTEMLKMKAVAQGAEFMSYDAVGGEWKFRVKHF